MRRMCPLLVLMLFLLTSFGCSINPATGARSLTLLSWDREVAMGTEAAPTMAEQFGGKTPDAEVQRYVNEVGHRLLNGIEDGVPDLPWEFTMVDSKVINAFALPGGKVFISRGLAAQLHSEAELAGVLGHEIGHVTARHANQRISKQLGINGIIAIGALIVGAADENSDLRRYGQMGLPALALGGQVMLLKYGRDEELQADQLGIRYMTRAGYNPIGQRRVMETLEAEAKGPRPPEWLSTHPATRTRIKRIDEMLRSTYASTQHSGDYVLKKDEYQRRMLDRLSKLPPPRHGSQPATSSNPR